MSTVRTYIFVRFVQPAFIFKPTGKNLFISVWVTISDICIQRIIGIGRLLKGKKAGYWLHF